MKNKKLKIAMLAPFEETVPPKKYGGTELVIYNLIQELVKDDHEVSLFSVKESRNSGAGEVLPIFEHAIRGLSIAKDAKIRESLKYIGAGRIATVLNQRKFDIVHNHIGWRMLPFADLFKSPTITTLHGPLDVPYMKFVYGQYSKANYVSISYNQRRPLKLNYTANVYNGIEVSKFDFSEKPGSYYAFLARISPEKGALQAIEIAKKAKVQLKMAAKIDEVDRQFYEKKIKPLIDGRQISLVGEVGHKEKVKLLKNAKALFAPIQWEEPFGLYFIEAMACGTPVITMKRGSAPEIVVDKKTGFLCRTVDEAAKKVKEIDQIDRKYCRNHVEKHFSSAKMAERYLSAYRKVIKAS